MKSKNEKKNSNKKDIELRIRKMEQKIEEICKRFLEEERSDSYSYLDEKDSRKRAGQLRELLNNINNVDNQIIELTKKINIIRVVRTDRIELNFDKSYWGLNNRQKREELLAALEMLSIEHPDYKNKLEIIRELCLGIRALDEQGFEASEEQMNRWKDECTAFYAAREGKIDKSEHSFA